MIIIISDILIQNNKMNSTIYTLFYNKRGEKIPSYDE